MQDFSSNIESSHRGPLTDSACLQGVFNNILREIVLGHISREKDLLLEVKRKWKYLDFNRFSTIGDFIISMAAVMDEALKIFRYLRFTNEAMGKLIDGVYVAYDIQRKPSSTIEAWMFWSGKEEKKQKILCESMHWLETIYPEIGWIIRGIDLQTGEHVIRMKKIS
ncbi:hypothetical protein [Alteribacillus sp. YIM 98480]|uniref:hypothetical protein n=1 Tax=Alteribacillus sp. YIM 98480 TaxID=2606599 RepID=UPI00131AA434|nr:hypothetical protein [Alteribacillus sp. YIM 98480]